MTLASLVASGRALVSRTCPGGHAPAMVPRITSRGMRASYSSLLVDAPTAAMQQQQPAQAELDTLPQVVFSQEFGEKWRTGEAIGTGSFGQVRVAVHRDSGERAAVKIMSKVRGRLSQAKTMEKIAREIGFVQRLQGCTSVVRLLGCYEDASNVKMVTELCHTDLRRYVQSYGALDEASLVCVTNQILNFLKYCHDQGVYYGDVKPANFCLNVDSINNSTEVDAPTHTHPSLHNLRVVDFGCTQQITGGGRLTSLVGTFVFMAPECYTQSYALKADIWSLGVTLYWLYSMRYPFWPSGDIPALARLEDMAAAATHSAIKYECQPWPSMSTLGLEFIQRCLCRDEDARMSVYEALQHPWLTSVVGSK